MQKKNPKVLSIIVTYNALRNDWINLCLSSLGKSEEPTDIIVVDNASTDNTVDYIKSHFPVVDVHQSKTNLGFGSANNIALKKCLERDYDFAFLLNQDAWIDKSTIKLLVSVSLAEPNFGVISPIHLNGDGSKLDKNFSNCLTPQKCKGFLDDVYFNRVKDNIYEAETSNAAAWLITKECIKNVGGFSPTFFHYAEDDNYLTRVKFHSFKHGIFAKAVIYHDREDRKVSLTLKNEIDGEIRKMLLLFSDPNLKKKYALFSISLIKEILRYFLIGDFRNVNVRYKLLTYLFNKRNNIIRNKMITKKSGPSFL
ncbi:glycosyltransferase [Nubsella zeaxanthinifaciens]|uniref:glycosyltransferase n=1 Tax=Nubsella zeaxanthinifaciens TaxID=392412 RepID=UPI0013002CC6|nr:glycosyltransferase family 2 protein [Nubsella zeaxanthinifaciens]